MIYVLLRSGSTSWWAGLLTSDTRPLRHRRVRDGAAQLPVLDRRPRPRLSFWMHLDRAIVSGTLGG
jgi:hypothetical protein